MYTLFSTLIIIINVMRVISEGSCDTEDWSNDPLTTGINCTLLYIHIENS